MLSKFEDLGVKMSIKVHYMFGHLDSFSANVNDLSECSQVHEREVSGRCNAHVMAHYGRSLQRNSLAAAYSRKSYKRKFVNFD